MTGYKGSSLPLKTVQLSFFSLIRFLSLLRIVACTTLSLAIIALTVRAYGFHILIDPGHGGKDSGATRGQLKESEIALKVAGYLADELRKDSRFKVSLTRTSDESLSLKERTSIAREINADLFLSIHLNSSKDPRAHGKEFYFQNQLPADEEALFLASRENMDTIVPDASRTDRAEKASVGNDLKNILEDLKRNHRIHSSCHLSKALFETWISGGESRLVGSRSIRQAPFYVVSHISVPSVLVELGFLSHATEGPRLAQPEYQKELAASLYRGIVKYKERSE
jgi:N-acetylmuramoyl-L-alanine amidase